MRISTTAELDILRQRVKGATEDAVARLASICQNESPLDIFRSIRFERIGIHPASADPLNLIEQIHQTFTIVVTINATKTLIEKHPGRVFKLNLAERSGWDIESDDENGEKIVAEVFAAVDPTNNRKLAKDLAKVRNSGASHKYVFFYAPGYIPDEKICDGDVRQITLGL
jgi:hypothetical protein